MPLMTNGSPMFARFLAGPLASLAPVRGPWSRLLYANAAHFGDDTSWPQGFPSVLNAMVPPLVVDSGQAAASLDLDVDLSAAVTGVGVASASLELEIDLTADSNPWHNAYADLALEVDLSAAVTGIATASATLDWVSRPSAGDISQEIWNSFSIESGMTGADILRVLLAVAAGKTTIAGTAPTVVTFRNVTDTADRVRAELTGSERDAVTIDGGT